MGNAQPVIIGKDIGYAAHCLREGKLIGVPTETVYGLAASATDAHAVAALYAAKRRPTSLPLILHIASRKRLSDFASDVPDCAVKLADAFWPGPLTLVLPKKCSVADFVTGGSSQVALRVPQHRLMVELLEHISVPLVAPSANPFGYISPTTPEHVHKHLGDRLAYIIDGGPCVLGIESTIIGFECGRPTVYRHGALCIEDIEQVIGSVRCARESKNARPQHLPGSSSSHYAPKKPLFSDVDRTFTPPYSLEEIGVLAFRTPWPNVPLYHQKVLSEQGCLIEAAHNLFDALHALDELPIQAIVAEALPSRGMGRALRDRLTRASHPKCILDSQSLIQQPNES